MESNKISNILKPKEREEISKSLDSKPIPELLSIGMSKNFDLPILMAIDKGALDNKVQATHIFEWAVKMSNYDIIKKTIDVVDDTRLLDILNNNSRDDKVVDIFIQHGVIPIDKTAMICALEGSIESLKKCLPFIDPSENNNVLLSFAIYLKNKDIIKLLLKDSRVKEKLTQKQIDDYEKLYTHIVKESLVI